MSHRIFCTVTTTILAVAAFASPGLAAEDDDLAGWIPASANSIAVVRAEKLLHSPLGRKKKWSQQQREAYDSGLISTPPGVEALVRATEFRIGSGVSPLTISLYRTAQETLVRQIAQRDNAKVEKVGDYVAYRSGRGPYFVQLANKLMGGVQPADRQLLSRWLRAGKSAPPAAADSYLRTALTSDPDDQVVIALDLSDMLDAESVAAWISSLPNAREFQNVDGLAALFASIRGVRLALNVTDKIVCKLQLTFGEPVGPYAGGVEKCVLAWLDEAGGRMDQFDAPEAKVTGGTISLQTVVDEEAMRRVMSLIQTPHEIGPAAPEAEAGKTADGVASRNYFQAVEKLVQSLSRQNRKASDYNRTALWHDNFARKIEELSTAGVDPDLAAWGKSVATNLHALANSLRGVPVEVNRLQRSIRVHVQTEAYRYASTTYADLYRPGRVYQDSNLSEVRASQAEAIARGNDQRDEIWQMLNDDHDVIKKKMEEKYKIPFGTAAK